MATQETAQLIKIKGFETLFAKEFNGKLYIFSIHEKTFLRSSGFETLAELEAYANEKYYDEYV